MEAFQEFQEAQETMGHATDPSLPPRKVGDMLGVARVSHGDAMSPVDQGQDMIHFFRSQTQVFGIEARDFRIGVRKQHASAHTFTQGVLLLVPEPS